MSAIILSEIQNILQANASKTNAAAKQIVVPGTDMKYGVKNPVLNDMAKKYKNGGFTLVEALWQSGAYEEKILAGKILRLISKKDPDLTLQLVEKFSYDIYDWAVCDTLGMQSIKPINTIKQKEIIELATKLAAMNNAWQKRLSLVMLEDYTKNKALHPIIFHLIYMLKNENDYYVKKAITWIKRNIDVGR